MIFSWLAKSVLGSVFSVATDGIKAWTERKKIRQQATIARESKLATAEVDWDMAQVKNSESSWKDEFWTIVLAIPAICAFVPGLAPYIEAGFLVLAETPDWYKAAFGVAIAAAFGVRKIAQVISAKNT